MKLSTTETGDICLEEVFNPVVFCTKEDFSMGVVMKDFGYEISVVDKEAELITIYAIQPGCPVVQLSQSKYTEE